MLRDQYHRPVQDLRISVTDRCNYRCTYCMPLDEYVWIERREILSYEETERVARIFIRLGVTEIRITVGEPLVRHDLQELIARLAPLEGLRDLSLTTNGALLAAKAPALRRAGLRRLNVSLDTLDPERFRKITQRGELAPVLEGLAVAKQLGFGPIKINAVIERGVNEQDILPLVDYARENGFAIRFIEYMDVGNSNNWQSERMLSKQEILERVRARYPLEEKGREGGTAPAVDYRLAEGGDLGVIASVTEPFCTSCTRVRLTADGKLVTCLFSHVGHDLKGLLRHGASDADVEQFIGSLWTARHDRYSLDRLQAMNSGAGYQPASRKKIEMITLGG